MTFNFPVIEIYNHLPNILKWPIIRILFLLKNIHVKWSKRITLFRKIDGKMQITAKGTGKCIIRKNCEIRSELTMENDVLIDEKCRLVGGPITIGKGKKLMKNTEIMGKVDIGRYCAIARKNVFQSINHPTSFASTHRGFHPSKFDKNMPTITKGGIKVGSDVWVGTGCIILPGVKIGHGAVIGAGAVVTKNVKPYSMVAGVPATHIKYRFERDKREILLELKWWNWSENKIKRNEKFFTSDLHKIKDIYSLVK